MPARANTHASQSTRIPHLTRYTCWCGYPGCAGVLHQLSRWRLLFINPAALWCDLRQGSRVLTHRRAA